MGELNFGDIDEKSSKGLSPQCPSVYKFRTDFHKITFQKTLVGQSNLKQVGFKSSLIRGKPLCNYRNFGNYFNYVCPTTPGC